MKKRTISALSALLVMPFLTHCASQQDVSKLDYQLRIVNKKVEDMKKDAVGTMQENQAASSNQIEEMQRNILALQSQVDELTHYNNLLKEKDKEMASSLSAHYSTIQGDLEKQRSLNESQLEEKDKKIQILEAQLSQNKAMLTSMQQSRIDDARKRANAAAQAAEEARNKANQAKRRLDTNGTSYIQANKTKKIIPGENEQKSEVSHEMPSVQPQESTQVTTSTAPASSSTSSNLDAAQKAFASGDYQTAYKLFSAILSQNARGPQGETAQYMKAESLYALGNYTSAIIEYQNFRNDFSNSSKCPSAFYKQAMAFEKTKENDTAILLYNSLIRTYPSSPEAEQAKKRLTALQ